MTVTVITHLLQLFIADNKDFLITAFDQMQDGASWEYVGPRDLDPTAKAIPLQCMNGDTPCGEPYIIYKLKK